MPEKEVAKSRLGTLLIICLFIVATLSAGYIGYWWGTRDDQLTSSPGWNTYTDKNMGFALAYPATWRGELPEEGYLLFKGPADDKGHVPNIIVRAMRSASSGGNYTSYEDAASEMLSRLKTYDNYSLSSRDLVTVCNESARELVCAYSFDGVALKQAQVIFQDPRTEYIYMIVFTATEASYPDYIAAYEKAKQTFTFGPEWKTFTDQKLGFALAYPATWRGEITKDGYLLFKGPVDVKSHSPNIIVQAMRPASMGGNYSSYEDAASKIVNQLKTNDNFTLSSYTQTTICNTSARELVCAYSYNGLALKQSRIIFQDSSTGYIYMIVYTATETSYPEYIGVCEKAKATFRFDRVNTGMD
jgi:hypothetical protein